MGSGCNNSNNFGKCFETTTDNCVIYTGEAIPILGICEGDRIGEVTQVIIERLLEVLDGESISLPDLTFNCPFVATQMIGKDKNLYTVLQMLADSSCTLKALVDSLTTSVNTPITYDPKCLEPATNNTQGVLQAAVNELCTLRANVATLTQQIQNQDLSTTINSTTGNYLKNNIKSYQNYGIDVTGTGESTVINLYAHVPPFTPLWSYAPLYWFDSSGKGLPNTPMARFFICNGLNNTPDMRGFGTAGAVNLPGINGNTLYPEVSPTVQNDPDISTNILDRKGAPKKLIGNNNIPPHIHPVIDPGHSHGYEDSEVNPTNGGTIDGGWASNHTKSYSYLRKTTDTSTTGITVGANAGGNEKFDNRPATVYGYYIVQTY